MAIQRIEINIEYIYIYIYDYPGQGQMTVKTRHVIPACDQEPRNKREVETQTD